MSNEPIQSAILPSEGEAPTTVKPSDNEASPKSKKPLVIGIAVAVLILSGFAWWMVAGQKHAGTAVKATPTGKVLRIGTIIDEDGVAANTAEFKPFIEYMVKQLKSEGYTSGEFVPETSVATMAVLLREGKVDLYIDSLFPVFAADELSGSQLIADRWKGGAETYHAAIFVKASSPIKTAADLKGKMIGFDSTTSTVAYFLPKALLTEQGYTLTQKTNPTDPVAANEIGFTLVHAAVYDDVQNGVVPAGAESELEIRAHFGPTFDSNYRIIMTSPDVMRFAVAARKSIEPATLAAIKSTLFSMNQSTEGQAVLKQYSDTAKFTPVAADSDTAYGEVQKLIAHVQDEIVRGAVGAGK